MTKAKLEINKSDYEKILAGKQGTIVQDFNNILSFIEKKGGVILTPSETAFGMADLSSLNATLSNPQKISLARPQQKAFPYLQSLFMLLRLSPLTLVKKEKNKSVLGINHSLLDSWRQLKPVEQYGHLLAYLLHPEACEVIGEHFQLGLMKNLELIYENKNRFLEIINDRKRFYSLPNFRIAALELFGILSIKPIEPKKGGSWGFEHLSITPYGDDIMKYIATSLDDEFGHIPADALFSVIMPLFPDWKTIITTPKKEPQMGVHVFKVSLGKAWRQIAIPGDVDFYDFGDFILELFEFENDHLHEFSYRNQNGTIKKISHYECLSDNLASDEVLIGELNLQIGAEMDFLFDFGDSWHFHILLEELDPKGLETKKPVLLKKHGKPPMQYEYHSYF